jgi:hypothetical protein
MLRTSDEEDLEKLCWIPFGIQTLSVGEEGGIFLLEPEDKQFAREDQIFLTIPKNSVNMDKCKKLTIRYAILMHGPFVLDEGYKLASPVVYINFDPEHILQTSCLYLQLPHWASEKEKVYTAVAPHSVNEKQQYKFELQEVEKSSSGKFSVIPISGHASLYSDVFHANLTSLSKYVLLPFSETSGMKLRVYVVYNHPIWCKIVNSLKRNRKSTHIKRQPFSAPNNPDVQVATKLPRDIALKELASCIGSDTVFV